VVVDECIKTFIKGKKGNNITNKLKIYSKETKF